jgi:1-acyl-sn-glycerol-3-phosphate acyltransferase
VNGAPAAVDHGPDVAFFTRRFVPGLAPLAAYHRFKVAGAEHLPRSGAALLAVTHSAATYETILIVRELYRATGRIVRGLGDRAWFKVPVLGASMRKSGFINASYEAARPLLLAGEIVGTPPGGMNEALRTAKERFQVRWAGRKGFVRLALTTGTPVVLGACPAADLIYTVHPSRLTDWGYRRWKLPFFVMNGVGPTLVPRPIALCYHLAPPIEVTRIDSPSAATVDELHALVSRKMAELIARSVDLEGLADARRRR